MKAGLDLELEGEFEGVRVRLLCFWILSGGGYLGIGIGGLAEGLGLGSLEGGGVVGSVEKRFTPDNAARIAIRGKFRVYEISLSL